MSLDSPSFEPSRDLMRIARFAVVTASYNEDLVERLCVATCQCLKDAGVRAEYVERYRVPGSNEIPYMLNMLSLTGEYDCLIGLGVVIAGDTQHHAMIEKTTASAIQQIALQSEIPCINGIITTETREQAQARANDKINRGREFALAAMCMAQYKIQMFERLDQLDYDGRSRRNTLENN